MFACKGETLVGSLDDAAGSTGLLIVTGGNEVRAGAHRGMALLAPRLAADGVPVFRYDRRGVGDSGGDNPGFVGAREDLLAAADAFRAAAPGVTRIVGFGNCDAATTLAWWGREAGCFPAGQSRIGILIAACVGPKTGWPSVGWSRLRAQANRPSGNDGLWHPGVVPLRWLKCWRSRA